MRTARGADCGFHTSREGARSRREDPQVGPVLLSLQDRRLPLPGQVLEGLGVEHRLVELAGLRPVGSVGYVALQASKPARSLLPMRAWPAHAPRVVALALAMAAFPVGCGGDDSGDAGGGGGLSVSEYRERGNALCAEEKDALLRISPPTRPQEIAAYLEESLRVGRRYDRKEDETLEPPPLELRGLHQRLERLDARVEAALERTIERVKRSDAPEVTFAREISKLTPDLQQGIELARKAGLKECAEVALPTEQRAT
jgi:hypothetical protein